MKLVRHEGLHIREQVLRCVLCSGGATSMASYGGRHTCHG
jgi:hypothetical protein